MTETNQTVASEIQRIQNAKAAIKTSIEWKWVAVPSSAKLDTYSTYIDSIQWWWIYWVLVPATIRIDNALSNSWTIVSHEQSEILNSNWDIFYCYFWFSWWDNEEKLWVWKKEPRLDPTLTTSNASWSTRWYFDHRWFRMKRVWNDIKFSVIFYEWSTSNPRTAKNAYYCINATNTTFWEKIFLWNEEDVWLEAIYNQRTQECWITDQENIPSIHAVSLSFATNPWTNSQDLIATIL